jgi:SAM-dependent methyltransferase/predicted O-methyltransferase YrrM
MIGCTFGKRERHQIRITAFQADLALARRTFDAGRVLEAVDIFEQLVAAYPVHAVPVLAELYDCYQRLPSKDRYHLYQARHFDFGILPGDKVLDIGSGHLPFPLATHLADVTLDNHTFGRAGVPFKHIDGKPVYECSVEKMPFADREFDFVYCSHVIEHVAYPEKACRELMRVGRRGYIETPTKGKDIFLNSAAASHHTRYFELYDGKLICSEYTEQEIIGLQSDILQRMHSAPQTQREKAFAALIWLKADLVNTMFLWEGSFEFELRSSKSSEAKNAPARHEVRPAASKTEDSPRRAAESPCTFLQIHTFYSSYLENFYRKQPGLAGAAFDDQINALVRDGFSGIHIFAPYMAEWGYRPRFIVANNAPSQRKWLAEQGLISSNGNRDAMHETVRRQIELIRPEILYLSDPVSFDSRFIRALSWKPRLVLGWRAANIASDTDWSEFDVMLSSLSGLRQAALELGANTVEHFFPGYPSWINDALPEGGSAYDVVFSGSWTTSQHARRNQYLLNVARAAVCSDKGFSCGFYINGSPEALPPEIQRINLGGRFGIEMHAALRSGRIVLDARGIIEHRNSKTHAVTDLAGGETANMRIFEVTGSGRFLLTEHHENLSSYFEPGVEIESFRDEAELIEKIRYYLLNPEKREAIARRGQERCLRDYSMRKRASELDRIIRMNLRADRDRAPKRTAGTDEGIYHAERLLECGKTDAAFEVLVNAKSLQAPREGIDLLRARCFMEKGKPMDAIEALREELRWFPENQAARTMMGRLQAQALSPVALDGCDNEFRQVLKVIRPYTMLSDQRLCSLYRLARQVCENNVCGNFVECGVAAGGSSALLAWVIKRYSRHPRKLFAFDSFAGMPRPTADDKHQGVPAGSTGWGAGTCSAPETSVLEVCSKLGAADVLTTVKGYFEQTLPSKRDWAGMIALLHMDGDWYRSTRSILDNLYERLTNEAVVQVDDYGYWDGCRKAIHDFEAARSIRFNLKPIDGTGVWFVKPERFAVAPYLPAGIIHDFQQDDPLRCGIESQMSSNERFQLYYAVRNLLPLRSGLRRFVEVGSYAGASLYAICMALQRTGAAYQGIAVEPVGRPGFKEISRRFRNRVIHLPLYSHEAVIRLAHMFDQENLPDFILIDGDHSYRGVRQDIVDYYPLLAPGGIMMFHDYLPPVDDHNREFIHAHHAGTEPGIRHACQELMEITHGLQPIELPLLYPDDPSQTQAHLPIIPGVSSTIQAYRKPGA